MNHESFESMLMGGHPNSLGRTVQVVEIVLADQEKLAELYECYFSSDEVVRLRTSSAMKKVFLAEPQWLMPYLDRLLSKISKINQASTQWTLALLYNTLSPFMSKKQHDKALQVLKRNLEKNEDWKTIPCKP